MKIALFGSSSPTSFGTENDLWRTHFKDLGQSVRVYDRHEPLNEAPEADLAFVHPLYSEGDPYGTYRMHDHFRVVGGKDVANYSFVGPRGRKVLGSAKWDFLALPYIPPTISKGWNGPKLVHWPRGLDREITKPLSPVEHPVPRVLLWAENACWERKGMDLNREVLVKLQEKGYRFETIIKTRFGERALNFFRDVKRKVIAVHYVDLRTVRRIYDSCDILLHLHRGGGQEMCPMEAIARGAVPVLPNAGCSLEYATSENSVLIPTGQWVPEVPGWIESSTGGSDSGYGYEADVNYAVSEMQDLLDNLRERKERALLQSHGFIERWNVDRVLRENWARLVREFPAELSS